ncbi:MAG TPA: M23 family metallopeptidase, partial [Bacillota bacterium]|nr:M23 family metallopeptidase [Bacillota bacterium]
MKSSPKKPFLKYPLYVTLLLLSMIAVMAALPGTALAFQTAYDFRYPLDSGGWFLGQAFGAWNKQQNAYHLAEDLLPNNYVSELPVYAPANGYVRHSGYQSGYGYVLVIEHRLPDNTYVCSVLGHLKAANLVPKGAEVVKGQLVGRISAYPAENGGYNFSHLHFGIRSGAYSTARDLDGAWRYQGYSPLTAVLASWYHPSNFVKAHSSPPPSPQSGSLRVSISPQEAVQAGARWRIAGTSTWRNSGETVSQIPAGSYTVEFRDVSGWDRPSSQKVTVSGGQVKTISASYTKKQAAPAVL